MSQASPKYRLHASIGYQLTLTSRVQEKRLDEKLKSIGLTRVTWCVLLAVENEGLSKPSEIAKFVGIDRTATSRALRQMEKSGLVSRKTGLKDRRTTQVRLTQQGCSLIDAATPWAQENSRLIDAKLDPAEQAELRRLLSKVRAGERIELDRF